MGQKGKARNHSPNRVRPIRSAAKVPIGMAPAGGSAKHANHGQVALQDGSEIQFSPYFKGGTHQEPPVKPGRFTG